MDLILWRHADAEEGAPDLARKLTPKGERQAARVAAWLREHLPENYRLLASPAVRAQQTAEALGKPTTEKLLAPGATAPQMISRLHGEITRVINDADIRSRLASQGVDAAGNTPEQFAALIAADLKKYADLVRRSGAKAE